MKYVPRIAVIFDRRHRVNINSPQPVEIRVTIGKRQTFHNTGVRLLPNEWRGEMVVNRPDASELNETISILKRRIEKELNRQIEDGEALDVRKLHLERQESEDFIDFVKERACVRPVRESTRKRYDVFLSKFEPWGKIHYFCDLTLANVKLWDDYLHTQGVGQGTVYNYHKCLKLFINDAIALGKLQYNPYVGMKGKVKRGDKIDIDYLTDEELKQMREATFTDRMYETARDLFLFQCYTGLAFADLMKFDISKYNLVDGKYIKADERTKTGTQYALQLLGPAVDILKKYDMKLPRLTNQDYNRRLKVAAAQAGIKKRIHTHMGRSTFATFALSHGVPLHIVSRMLGHTNTKQTLRYADILMKDVRENYDKIDSLFKPGN